MALAVSCGSGGGTGATDPSKKPPTDENDPAAGGEELAAVGGDAGEPAEIAQPPEPEPPLPTAPVTFIFKNAGETDLTFALDKGWGSTVFAYSGKPPKAVPMTVFPKYCTGPCAAEAPEEACPVCKEAETPKERQEADKAETKREVIVPGAQYNLDWDGLALVYAKAPKEKRGKNKKCECYTPQPPAAASYTVRACALRTASELGKTSKMECVEATIDLPIPDGEHVDLEFVFGAPAAAPAKGKGK